MMKLKMYLLKTAAWVYIVLLGVVATESPRAAAWGAIIPAMALIIVPCILLTYLLLKYGVRVFEEAQ